MRRMITNKQVVNIVNEAIESGEIEVGGAGSLYKHDIVFIADDRIGTISLYTDTNTAINSVVLLQSYLNTKGYNSSANVLTISNYSWMDAETGDTNIGFGIYNDNGTIMLSNFSPYNGEGVPFALDNISTIRDTVVAL